MKNLLLPDLWVKSVYDLSPDLLKKLNIRGLVLDIDNTLVTYDDAEPDAKLINWLKTMKIYGFKICLVSNNNRKRVELFNHKLSFDVFPRAMKPFPTTIKKAVRTLDLNPEEAVMVGDQLFTDVLGGRLAGVKTILVDYIRAKESVFFKIKRLMERPFLWMYKRKNL